MKTISVKTWKGGYSILVGKGLLSKLGSFVRGLGFQGKILIVTQRKVARYHLKPVCVSLRKSGYEIHPYFLPNGETAKSEKELFRLYRGLLKLGFERRDGVLALGGGVTGDLSGFAAATYMRGIRFINAATTLLAQVDSAIGGKTGIDLEEGKNLVGAFYPPRLVISDTGTLKTLPDREFRSSLAEVVKYGVIHSSALFRYLEKNVRDILRRKPECLEKIVLESARIKARVVGSDEFETQGRRMILNFGHTFGHAFELAGGYRQMLHGEAVSIGMVCAVRLARQWSMLSQDAEEQTFQLLKNFGLPVSLNSYAIRTASVLSAMSRDKKKHAGKVRFVLPARIGKVVIREDVPFGLVRQIIYQAGGK